MFLKHIRLHQFKCLEDFELDFSAKEGNRRWTILLGENGTGKSNLLKAIALVTAGSNALGELIDTPENWIQNGKNECRIDALLTTQDGQERKLSLQISRNDSLTDVIVRNKRSLDEIDKALNYSDRSYFVVGYGASRTLSKQQFSNHTSQFRSPRSRSVGNLFNAASLLNPISSWAMELDYRNSTGDVRSMIGEALNSFMTQVRFVDIDKRKGQLIFETPDGRVPLEQLSDGYQNVTSWLGDLLYRITETFDDYKNPLQVRGLLLIDEVDLHIHPKWQRMLYEFIQQKLPNFQIVCTTHSPLTAQQAGDGELFTLRRDEKNKVRKIPFIGTPNKMLIHQLLMSPVFGLETDESVEIQKARKTYTQLGSQKSLNKTETASLVQAKAILQEQPVNVRSNISNLLDKDGVDLMARVASELLKKRQSRKGASGESSQEAREEKEELLITFGKTPVIIGKAAFAKPIGAGKAAKKTSKKPAAKKAAAKKTTKTARKSAVKKAKPKAKPVSVPKKAARKAAKKSSASSSGKKSAKKSSAKK
jgi:predicted ATPase